MDPETVEFTVPARLVYIGAAESLLATVLSTLELDDGTGHDVRLSVHEALVNAWRHGAGEDPDVEITLRIQHLTDGLEVEVEDKGGGFEPEEVQDPTTDEGRTATCGRGIFLMRSLVDRVEIDSRVGGPTRVFLAKKWPDGTGGSVHEDNGDQQEGREET